MGKKSGTWMIYERWESKECKEVKIVSNYREPGIMPLSPHAFTKTMSLVVRGMSRALNYKRKMG